MNAHDIINTLMFIALLLVIADMAVSLVRRARKISLAEAEQISEEPHPLQEANESLGAALENANRELDGALAQVGQLLDEKVADIDKLVSYEMICTILAPHLGAMDDGTSEHPFDGLRRIIANYGSVSAQAEDLAIENAELRKRLAEKDGEA